MPFELKPLKRKSSHVHSAGFEGETRGNLHIQFKDKAGNLTTAGHYEDVPRNCFNMFEASESPGSFVQQQLKPFFKWVSDSETKKSKPDEGVGCGCIDGMAR